MKKVATVIGIFLLSATVYAANLSSDDFCDGYDDGYKEGWCYGQFSCIKPISPICPIPRIGEDGYRDGYNRGFIDGRRAKG
ncbi:hypothetical protein [Chromobacterium sp.]|uniref:hypothetical protein n=1 Tax=Chromobacterium sp. TaxID=306190 RepID=UPI0035AEB293